MGKDGQPWWEEAISILIVTCLCSEFVIWSKYQDILIDMQLSNDGLQKCTVFFLLFHKGLAAGTMGARLPELALVLLSSL